MWEFNIGRAFGAAIKTLPFVFLRLLVYLGITLAYLLCVATGSGIGYGLGSIVAAGPLGAAIGGLSGFGVVSFILFFARAYLLYLVKAGHIAVLVEYVDGKELPKGKGQISYAQGIVKEHFKETSVLFGVDLLIRSVLSVVHRAVFSISHWIPIAGMRGIMNLINKLIEFSLTYTDELILAYNIRTKSKNPWASSRDALILYAQNYKTMLKNALFLLFFVWGITLLIFFVCLAPAGILMALFPGEFSGWVFVVAFLMAWIFKQAVLEPLSIAAMMQAYFKAIEGETPNPEWDAKLSSLSGKFVELKSKAAMGF